MHYFLFRPRAIMLTPEVLSGLSPKSVDFFFAILIFCMIQRSRFANDDTCMVGGARNRRLHRDNCIFLEPKNISWHA